MEYLTITDPGKTTFMVGEVYSRRAFEEENERVTKLGEKPATGKLVTAEGTPIIYAEDINKLAEATAKKILSKEYLAEIEKPKELIDCFNKAKTLIEQKYGKFLFEPSWRFTRFVMLGEVKLSKEVVKMAETELGTYYTEQPLYIAIHPEAKILPPGIACGILVHELIEWRGIELFWDVPHDELDRRSAEICSQIAGCRYPK